MPELDFICCRSFVCLIVIGICQFASAGSPPQGLQSNFQAAVRDAQVQSNVPGFVAMLIDKDYSVVASAGLRAAEPAVPSPIAATDVLNIGSNFKAMTASIAGRLVEQGVVSWETNLQESFPEFTQMNPTFGSVTLEQLLSHRSGFLDEATDDDAFLPLDEFTGSASQLRVAFLEIYSRFPGTIETGEFSYSNLGYASAGAILERASGLTFDELIQRELAQPLGITTLIRGSAGSHDLANVQQPLGHDEDGIPVFPEDEFAPEGLEPAGLYSLSIEDWAKFVRVHMGHTDNYLSAETLEKLHSPVGGVISPEFGSYALGWSTVDDFLVHSGSNGSWNSMAVLNQENGRALLMAGNQGIEGSIAQPVLLNSPMVADWLAVPEPSDNLCHIGILFLLLGARGKRLIRFRG